MIVLMEQTLIYLSLIMFGLVFGSFAGATIWRLRARQLDEDKKEGEEVDKSEYKKLHRLTKASLVNDRSRCLNCSYILRWYDLIPILSWLSLGGKCRKCRKPIGYLEPLIEIGVAGFFVLSFAFWPHPLNNYFEIFQFIVWLVSGVLLAILFVYDLKWSILPDKVNYLLIFFGFLNAAFLLINSRELTATLLMIIGSFVILCGVYLLIYIISKGMWIGFGDVKLTLGLSLILADWRLSFIALFSANLVGCLIVLPAIMAGKLKRNSRIPFGPLLIVGYVIAGLFGITIIHLFTPTLL